MFDAKKTALTLHGLRQLKRTTGWHTAREQQAILKTLSPEQVTAVAYELQIIESETTDNANRK